VTISSFLFILSMVNEWIYLKYNNNKMKNECTPTLLCYFVSLLAKHALDPRIVKNMNEKKKEETLLHQPTSTSSTTFNSVNRLRMMLMIRTAISAKININYKKKFAIFNSEVLILSFFFFYQSLSLIFSFFLTVF